MALLTRQRLDRICLLEPSDATRVLILEVVPWETAEISIAFLLTVSVRGLQHKNPSFRLSGGIQLST